MRAVGVWLRGAATARALGAGLVLGLLGGAALAPAGCASAEELGLRYGSATVQSEGYSTKTYSFSQVIGFDLQAPVTQSSALQLDFETVGQPYMAANVGWRYFPFANASKRETIDAFAHLTAEDAFKPFFGLSLGVGRIRLRTLSAIIEAQEIGASFYSYGAMLGVLWRMTGRWSVGLDATYGSLTETLDSPVVFSGTRTALHGGLYIQL
jgi:opacity protein-like surface antigen